MNSQLPRHDRLGDLLGASTDPAPRKTMRIEWVGQPNPLDNPIVQWGMIQGWYSDDVKKAIRKAAAIAVTRVRRNRLLEHDHQHSLAAMKGLRRTYMWSDANQYICDVDYDDVDIIFSSSVANEFRNLDRDDFPIPDIMLPPTDLIVIQSLAVASKDAIAGALVASS